MDGIGGTAFRKAAVLLVKRTNMVAFDTAVCHAHGKRYRTGVLFLVALTYSVIAHAAGITVVLYLPSDDVQLQR